MAASTVIVDIADLGRVERNKRDKFERIVRAARTLFRRKGFDSTTTSEIAQLAEIGKGTLFVYAKTKEELLVMVFQEEVGHAIERAFSTVPETSFLKQALHVFEVMLEQNRRDLELARVFAKEMAFVGGDRHGIDAVMADFFDRMRALIELAQERGEIQRQVDPALLAYNLFALYFSHLVVWLGRRSAEPDPAKPSLQQVLELQLAGLYSSKTASRQRRNSRP